MLFYSFSLSSSFFSFSASLPLIMGITTTKAFAAIECVVTLKMRGLLTGQCVVALHLVRVAAPSIVDYGSPIFRPAVVMIVRGIVVSGTPRSLNSSRSTQSRRDPSSFYSPRPSARQARLSRSGASTHRSRWDIEAEQRAAEEEEAKRQFQVGQLPDFCL